MGTENTTKQEPSPVGRQQSWCYLTVLVSALPGAICCAGLPVGQLCGSWLQVQALVAMQWLPVLCRQRS